MAKVLKRGDPHVFEVTYKTPTVDPDLDKVMPGVWQVRKGMEINTGTKDGFYPAGTQLAELTKRQLIFHAFKLERIDTPGPNEPAWLANPSGAIRYPEHKETLVAQAANFKGPPAQKTVGSAQPPAGVLTEEAPTTLIED